MGQKVNPIGLRLGVNRTWDSRWFANKADYAGLLEEDHKIREFLNKRLKGASVSKIVIERPAQKCRVFIHTARPGVIIGKKGADIEALRTCSICINCLVRNHCSNGIGKLDFSPGPRQRIFQ